MTPKNQVFALQLHQRFHSPAEMAVVFVRKVEKTWFFGGVI